MLANWLSASARMDWLGARLVVAMIAFARSVRDTRAALVPARHPVRFLKRCESLAWLAYRRYLEAHRAHRRVFNGDATSLALYQTWREARTAYEAAVPSWVHH